MLTSLSIGNFKAFGETQTIPIRPITLIFGANSSGKSSIIHSLLLAKHALKTGNWNVALPDAAAGDVDLGGFPNYLHNHDEGSRLIVGIEVSNADSGSDKAAPVYSQTERFRMSFGVSKIAPLHAVGINEESAEVESLDLSLNGELLVSLQRRVARLPGRFVVSRVNKKNSVLQTVLTGLMKKSCDGAQEQEAYLRDTWNRPNVFSGPPPAHIEKLAQHESRKRTLRDDPAARAEEFNRLALVFEGMLKGFTFCIDGPPGFAVFDEDPANPEHWLQERLLEEGGGDPLGYFTETRDHSRDDEKSSKPWWPEARTACYELCRVLPSLTSLVWPHVASLTYLGPLRERPSRVIDLRHTTNERDSSTLRYWTVAATNERCQDVLNTWLGKGWLRTSYQFNPTAYVARDAAPGGSAPLLVDPDFLDTSTGLRLKPHELGVGMSEVLPVLVLAATAEAKTLAIEQPELHLHPAMQAELGDVFIESALGERKNTFLLETHSEHLILRIMRRIRETHLGKLPKEKNLPPVKPSDVAVLYVEKDGPRSIVRDFPLNERGELVKAWPGGFFEEAFNELFT